MNRKPDWIGLRLGLLRIIKLLRLPGSAAHRLLLPGSVGRNFRIARGSCLLGRQVRIGAGVSIGPGADITAETIELADGVTLGAGVKVRTKRLVMGMGARIDEYTTVYGMYSSRAGLVMGERAWLYSHCHINTDDLVTIGDRTAAGSHCLIFTHSSYLPITHGYPVTLAPVTLGSDVWLPWHAFILPGAVIGSGATVGAFSMVAGEVPSNSLAVGVPARVVKDAATFRRKYTPEKMRDLGRKVTGDVMDFIVSAFRPETLFFPDPRQGEEREPGCWILSDSRESVRVVLTDVHLPSQEEWPNPRPDTLYVTLGRMEAPSPGLMWCDLVTQKSNCLQVAPPLIREFMSGYSRFGIRFEWFEHTDGPAATVEMTRA